MLISSCFGVRAYGRRARRRRLHRPHANRILAVLHSKVPDRVPYYEAGVDYLWICRLLNRPLEGTENFDSGEYRAIAINDQLKLNQIPHRDKLVYAGLPPIPARR